MKPENLTLYTRVFAERAFRPNFYARFIKRPLDWSFALALLVIFSPVLLFIAAGIHFFSPGPVFYRQPRIGKDGKPFTMLKFRSMRLENNPELHRQYVQKLIRENVDPKQLGQGSLKLKSDPRITGLGRILRKLSLDELPQLINVLKGEMSLVGPRPPLPYEYEVYSDWHRQRLSVLPGITGLWQVTAHNTCSFNEMVRLDLEYIETMGLWRDLKIALSTPFEMMRGKGAG